MDIIALSETLATEVQFFMTHRVVELHHWERAVDGKLLRAFEYLGESGEITDWRGPPDEAEVAIGIPAALDDESEVLVSEMDVMRLAARWSLDPTALDGRPSPGPLHSAAAPIGT